MSRSLADIRSGPVRWVRLCAAKMLMVWNRYEVSDVESQYLYAEYSSLLKGLGRVWHFGVLCPLAALGAALTWRQWRRLWVYYLLIASMACSVALFYVMARYRFPLVPLLIPFAAAGCVYTWRRVKAGEQRRLLRPALIAMVVAVIVNLPLHDERRLNAMARMNLGVALAKEGELEEATGYFRAAVNEHPGSAEAQNNLAQALSLQGDDAGAIPHYEAALAVEPGLIGVNYNLGVALEHVGRIEDALRHYERAAELDPSDVEAREAIARLRGR
jgi:tetratricopeptide (TPR) repeat protein